MRTLCKSKHFPQWSILNTDLIKTHDEDGERSVAVCFTQAIQDITRIYDDPPEEIVTLIYERIDINNEGMNIDIYIMKA